MARLGITITCLALSLACVAGEASQETKSAPMPARYVELVEKGDEAFRRGEFGLAAGSYEAASLVPLHESPNYEVLLKLAEAYCRGEQPHRGRTLLVDFSCMLDVQIGAVACFGPAEIGYLGPRNEDLTDRCFERMCSELYLGYYEDPPEFVLQRVAPLRGEVGRVRALCR